VAAKLHNHNGDWIVGQITRVCGIDNDLLNESFKWFPFSAAKTTVCRNTW
jgi:hypothetical protein